MGLFDFMKKNKKQEDAAQSPDPVISSLKDSGDQAMLQSLVADKSAAMLLDLYRKQPGGFVKSDPLVAGIRSIGTNLNNIGGMDLMLETHKSFAASCNEIGPGLARNLEMMWDGIGDWRG